MDIHSELLHRRNATFPIDRNMTSDLMGFAKPYSNSLDAVSIVTLFSNSCQTQILMMHMTRIVKKSLTGVLTSLSL